MIQGDAGGPPTERTKFTTVNAAFGIYDVSFSFLSQAAVSTPFLLSLPTPSAVLRLCDPGWVPVDG